MKLTKRDLIIDADHIAFFVSESKTYKTGFEDELELDDYLDLEEEEFDLTRYKKHFKSIVKYYKLVADCGGIAYGWKIDKVKVILSDVTNFRYELYPKYKCKRTPPSEIRTKLRAWARNKYICEANTEADDVVAYYVRNGGVGITTDKDLFLGVEGIWYNAHYMYKKWHYTNKEDAEHFYKCQVLAGDTVDNIPSLPRVGLSTAEKILTNYGTSWDNIIKVFEDKGFDKDYYLTMKRLVSMNQWSPENGIQLCN